MEKYLGGGAFSSKFIQLCLNTIYNNEFRYNWGCRNLLGGAKHLGGGGGGKSMPGL